MTEAGFAQIDVTPDSASPAMIKNLKKGFAMEDIIRTAELIREFGLPSMWFFLFGGPGENNDTFRETLSFIDAHISRDDLVYMSSGLRIYPGTPLHQTALDEGIISKAKSLLNPPLYYHSPGARPNELSGWIREACSTRMNCLPSSETTPPQEMLKEAVELRSARGLDEPMFRTLLRLRREWKACGKL
jgi:anaerobic magnesium-protoporphyrin IX monomethyl ester cyclase